MHYLGTSVRQRLAHQIQTYEDVTQPHFKKCTSIVCIVSNAVFSTSLNPEPPGATHWLTEVSLDFSEALSQDCQTVPEAKFTSQEHHAFSPRAALGPGPSGYNACVQSPRYSIYLPYCREPLVPLGENYSLPSNHMTQSISHKAANVDHMTNN